jgi:hypothetical protein
MAPVLREPICADHEEVCNFCSQSYAPSSISNGRCNTCQDLSPGESGADLPEDITSEFASVSVATNSQYTILYGKRRLRSNQVVVVDRETGEKIHQRKVGLIERLAGVFR